MVNIKTPKVADLVKHIDDGSTWLSRIIKIDSNGFCYIKDEAILRNSNKHVLSESGISSNDIIQNYGNITLAQFKEEYPEWII